MKGEVSVFPLTDNPDLAFAPGRRLEAVNLAGEPVGEPLVVERSRGYHREWLVKFVGVDDRTRFGTVRDLLLVARAEDLPPLEQGEVYLHELAGFAVQAEDGAALGLVSEVLEYPAGITIEVQGPKREFLLPYRKEFVLEVDRDHRRLVVRLPRGLLEI